MTKEEINSLLEETNTKIEKLKENRKAQNEVVHQQLLEVVNKYAELFHFENLYRSYRTLLAFAYPEELSQEDRIKIENMMPLLDEHINKLKKELIKN